MFTDLAETWCHFFGPHFTQYMHFTRHFWSVILRLKICSNYNLTSHRY